MDPTELEALMRRADARYDAAVEAGNQAEADAIAADIRNMMTMYDEAVAGSTPQGTNWGATDVDTRFTQGMSGVNEGLANVAGAPVDVGSFLANVPSGFSNLVNRGVNTLFGTDFRTDRQLVDPDLAIGGSEWLKTQMGRDIPDIPLPFTDDTIAMGPIIAEDTGSYPGVRKAGEYAGTGLGTLLTLGAGSAAGLKTGAQLADDIATQTARELALRPVSTLTKETAASVAAVPGGKVGGDLAVTIADAAGAENPESYRQTGEMVGEIVSGAGTAATLEATNPGRLVASVFSDPESATRLAAADRLGVKPSTGMIGNQGAAYIENTSGLNPLSSGDVTRLQTRQVGELADAVARTTDDMRYQAGVPRADSPYSAGAQVRQAGESAYERIRRELGDLAQREMDTLGGETAALRIDRTRQAIEDAMPRLTPPQQKEMRLRLQDLEAMRVTGYDTVGSNNQYRVPRGTPVDEALDTQIRNRLDRRLARLEQLEDPARTRAGSNNPLTAAEKREARNLRHRIKVDIAQIDNNLGVPNQQMNSWRRELGQQIPDRGTVGSRERRETYGGIRDDQRIKAAQEGTLQEFAEVTGEQKRLQGSTALEEGGDADFFRRLTQNASGTPRESQEVWNFLNAKDAGGRIEAYRRQVSPEEFEATMGNMIDMMGRPTSQTARAGTMNTETFSPRKFMTEWKNLPKSTRDAIFDASDIEGRMKDIEALAEAVTARGTASNPSGTAATAIIAKIFGEGIRSPALTIATLTGNKVAARMFMSEPVARAVAAEYPTLYDEILRSLPQSTMRAQTVENEGAE